MKEKEIWKEIPGFSGCFASNLGRIKTEDRYIEFECSGRIVKRLAEGKIVNQRNHSSGYLAVNLHKNGKRQTFLVHRLIALTFLGQSENLTVNHIDGDKKNNKVENLEWITIQENVKKFFERNLDIHPKESRKKSSDSFFKMILKKTFGDVKGIKIDGSDLVFEDIPTLADFLCAENKKIYRALKSNKEFRGLTFTILK